VAFGETWLPGYPAWLDVCPHVALWEHLPTKQVFARLRQNSITILGPEVATLCEAAGDLKINVVMGVNERVEAGPGNGTLYNSLLMISPEAELANHHRKLVPTHTERLIWGNGDGRGLSSVKTKVGRIGGLICWEHWMPWPVWPCTTPANIFTLQSGPRYTNFINCVVGTMPLKDAASFWPWA
jgi:nitrilase